MSGFKKAFEVWPAILVSGVSFAAVQYLSSNFLGPELPDVLSALVSMAALAVFLKWWKPKKTFRFAGNRNRQPRLKRQNYTLMMHRLTPASRF